MEAFGSIANLPLFFLAVVGYALLFMMPVRERKAMWDITIMVVLTSLCAALYAVVLMPFKVFLPVIPGVTEIRPANAIPIAFSLLFGPAAAWGSGMGNLVGDLFFGLGPGSLFGIVGNFLYGLIPYVFWRALVGREDPDPRRRDHWAVLVLICAVASAACAFSIAWAIDVIIMGVPLAFLGAFIFFNNFLMAMILAPPLVFALLPRVRAWGLHFLTIMPPELTRPPRFARLGVVLMSVGALGGLAGGLAMDTVFYKQKVWTPPIVRALAGVDREDVKEDAGTPEASEAASEQAGEQQGGEPDGKATAPAQSLSERRIGLGLGLLPFLLLMSLGVFFL